MLDIDKQPAWVPIITQGVSIDKVHVWEALRSFPDLEPVSECRTRRIAHDRLRPQLFDSLWHAEIAVELGGRSQPIAS